TAGGPPPRGTPYIPAQPPPLSFHQPRRAPPAPPQWRAPPAPPQTPPAVADAASRRTAVHSLPAPDTRVLNRPPTLVNLTRMWVDLVKQAMISTPTPRARAIASVSRKIPLQD